MVIGSSLLVTPAATLPRETQDRNGGQLVILNLQKTPYDKDCDLRIFEKCDKVMKMLADALCDNQEAGASSCAAADYPKASKVEDQEEPVEISLVVGNRHQLLQELEGVHPNSHKWTVFVEELAAPGRQHLVEKVTFTLHPTFRPAVVEVTEPPFELQRQGWGTFDVGVDIQLCGGKTVFHVDHPLSFEGEGGWEELSLALADAKA